MRRILTAALASAGLLMFGAVSAHADDHEVVGDWVALDTDDGTGDPHPGTWSPDLVPVESATSSIVSPTEAVLVYPKDGPNLGTSIEVADLGLDVEAGTAEVTWQLEDGAAVAPGAPRLFVFVDGTQYNTYRDGTTTETGASVSIPAGTVGYVGVAYDNGVPGTVRVTGVSISGTPVLFAEPVPCEWDETLTAEDEACVQPVEDDQDTDNDTENESDSDNGSDKDSGNESDEGGSTPAPVPTAVPAGTSTLPDTGVNPMMLGAGALALLGAGGFLIWAGRRRLNQ